MRIANKAWVAGLFLLAVVGAARADSFMWWSVNTDESDPGIRARPGTDQQGADLIVDKSPLLPGEYYMTLILNARVVGTPLKGYALTMYTDPDSPIEVLDAQDMSGLPQPTPGDPPPPTSPPDVIINFGQTDIFGLGLAPGYNGPLMSLLIKITKTPEYYQDEQFFGGIKIFGEIGFSSWDDDATYDDAGPNAPDPDQDADPVDEFATFGSNLPIPVGAAAGGTSVGPNPLITIRNIPEPGTVALLAAGAALLAMRRRRGL